MYKRQALVIVGRIMFMIAVAFSFCSMGVSFRFMVVTFRFMVVFIVVAVSYTHLDVYKRQTSG